MKGGILDDTKKTLKDTARQVARQIVDENVEIVKDAVRTLNPVETKSASSNSSSDSFIPNEKNPMVAQNNEATKLKDARYLSALTNEINDIQRDKLFNELLGRIQQGEDISVEGYALLTEEQKAYLKGQIDLVKSQKQQAALNSSNNLPVMSSKPGRKFGMGRRKTPTQLEQTKTESPTSKG